MVYSQVANENKLSTGILLNCLHVVQEIGLKNRQSLIISSCAYLSIYLVLYWEPKTNKEMTQLKKWMGFRKKILNI